MPRPIALLTDFGLADIYVGVMKGVLLAHCSKAVVIDLTHAVPPGDIVAGAFQLHGAAPYLPEDTVFLAVVDPGVGGKRKPVCARAGGRYLVGPDNGLLWPAATRLGEPEFFHLDRPEFWLPHPSSTFHGRDLFAPVAAALAEGTPPELLGTPHPDPVTLTLPIPRLAGNRLLGEVLWIDRYGNAITNLRPMDLAQRWDDPACAVFSMGGEELGTPHTHYAAVLPGAVLVLAGSSGYYEIAVRDGSAANRLSLSRGSLVAVHAGS
jgi:S-adenosylmethionine hydrolase